MGGGRQAQKFLTPRHSWVVDGLHIDAVLGEQEVTDLAVECCITHLGSKEKPFRTSPWGQHCTLGLLKQVEAARSRKRDRLFFTKGLGGDTSKISIIEDPRVSNEI